MTWAGIGAASVAALLWLDALAMAPAVWKGLRTRYVDRWSGLGGLVCLVLSGALVLADGGASLPIPAAFLLVAWGVACWLLAPGISLWHAVRRRRGTDPPLPDAIKHEEARKGFHLLLGLLILPYLWWGQALLQLVRWLWIVAATPASWLSPGLKHEGTTQLDALIAGPNLAAGNVDVVGILLLFILLMIPQDLARLRDPDGPYPFRAFTERRLRERERGGFGHHLHILVATLPCLLILATPGRPKLLAAAVAVIAVTVFADAASALVGRRWGRIKWPHNANKSYVGSAAGVVVAFLVALPFTGPLVALVAALVFLIVDVGSPIPVPLSDNLLNPTAVTAAFLLMEDHLSPLVPLR